MIFNVYSIKDELTSQFLQPMFIQTEGEALRLFKHMINSNPLWKSNPAHFNLYHMGTFDDEKGFNDTSIDMVQGGTSVVERTENA